jgi:hypothetical protein
MAANRIRLQCRLFALYQTVPRLPLIIDEKSVRLMGPALASEPKAPAKADDAAVHRERLRVGTACLCSVAFERRIDVKDYLWFTE